MFTSLERSHKVVEALREVLFLFSLFTAQPLSFSSYPLILQHVCGNRSQEFDFAPMALILVLLNSQKNSAAFYILTFSPVIVLDGRTSPPFKCNFDEKRRFWAKWPHWVHFARLVGTFWQGNMFVPMFTNEYKVVWPSNWPPFVSSTCYLKGFVRVLSEGKPEGLQILG